MTPPDQFSRAYNCRLSRRGAAGHVTRGCGRARPIAARPTLGPDARDYRFLSLIDDHLDAAFNLAWWMTRDAHEAEDAVQEACLKAWSAFDAFRGGDGKAWLLRILRNAIIDRRRASPSRRGEVGAPDDAEAIPAHDPPADSVPGRAESAAALDAALMSLSGTFREIIILKDVAGLSYTQIASVLEVPIGTVMSRLSRARDAAREALRTRNVME